MDLLIIALALGFIGFVIFKYFKNKGSKPSSGGGSTGNWNGAGFQGPSIPDNGGTKPEWKDFEKKKGPGGRRPEKVEFNEEK